MASSSVDRSRYQKFVVLTTAAMEDCTLGQTLAKATMKLYQYTIPTQANVDQSILAILDPVIDQLNENKNGVKELITFCKDNSPNQLKTDLLSVIYSATSAYAAKNGISFEDELNNRKWVLENIRNALKANTLDGSEGDGSGGESGYEGDRDNF